MMWDGNFTIFRLEFKFRKQISQQQTEFLLIREKQNPYLEVFVKYIIRHIERVPITAFEKFVID